MCRLAAIILMILPLMGCAVSAPVALGTGSAVADIVLGEVIRAGAAEIAPQAVAMVAGGMDRLAYFGGNPKWAALVPGARPKIETARGMTFVGDWR